MIHTIAVRVAEPVVDLPTDPQLDLSAWQYRRVKLSGVFLQDKETYLYTGPKEVNGTIGYNLLTPFKLEDGTEVLVDRGWVPYQKKSPETRLETIPDGKVEVIGMIHRGEKPGLFTPKNDPDHHIWFWIDVPRLLGQAADEKTAQYYIRLLKQPGVQGLPLAGDETVRYRNDHLQYAITWYGLAVILIIVYGALRLQLLAGNSKD